MIRLSILLIMLIIVSCSSGAGGKDDEKGLTYDNETYKIVKIGSQTWMAENLNHQVDGSKCYGNEPDNCKTYGRLYDWQKANSVCPKGWHLPNLGEWRTLINYVENARGCSKCAAKFLKAKSGWDGCGNYGSLGSYRCEDAYGFAALPGGYAMANFFMVGEYGSWWTSSGNSVGASAQDMYNSRDSTLLNVGNDKSHLRSVRCLKNK